MTPITVADVIDAVSRAANMERANVVHAASQKASRRGANSTALFHAIIIVARTRTDASLPAIARAIGMSSHASVHSRLTHGGTSYTLGCTALGWALGYLVPRANAILDEEFPWTTKLASRAATQSPATESAAPTARQSTGMASSRPPSESPRRAPGDRLKFQTTP